MNHCKLVEESAIADSLTARILMPMIMEMRTPIASIPPTTAPTGKSMPPQQSVAHKVQVSPISAEQTPSPHTKGKNERFWLYNFIMGIFDHLPSAIHVAIAIVFDWWFKPSL